MSIEIRALGQGDGHLLSRVADGVFDGSVDEGLVEQFLGDDRHHLVVALDGGTVVGMASGVHYVHPDKQPELWVNEVGVADTHLRQGVATRVLRELFAIGRRVGCEDAWVLTEERNAPANRLYGALGGRREDERVVMFSFRLGDYR